MGKVVFFDLDGTLYDNSRLPSLMVLRAFRGNFLRNLRLMSAERRCRRKLSRNAKGTVGYDTLFQMMSSKVHAPADSIREWYNLWYMTTMVDVISRNCGPREGVQAKLIALRTDGARLAVLSDYGFVREKLEALGIDPNLFEALLDAPSMGGFKPSPDVFRAACQYMRCKPEDAMMVGDRPDTDGGSVSIGLPFTEIVDFL